jgi:hypothetical protein
LTVRVAAEPELVTKPEPERPLTAMFWPLRSKEPVSLATRLTMGLPRPLVGTEDWPAKRRVPSWTVRLRSAVLGVRMFEVPERRRVAAPRP